MRHKRKLCTTLILYLLTSLIYQPRSFAEDFSSTSFIIRDPIIDIEGGRSTSASFELFSATGQTAAGEITSTNFQEQSGFLYFSGTGTTALTQKTYRWYQSIDAIQPATALADENTAINNITSGSRIRLRIAIQADNEPLGSNNTFKLQYANKSTHANCSSIPSGNFADVGAISSNQTWSGANFTFADGAQITSKLLSTAVNGTLQTIEEENPSAANPNIISIGATTNGEWDWVLSYNGTDDSSTYCFRQVFANNTLLDTYSVFPTVTIQAPSNNSQPSTPLVQIQPGGGGGGGGNNLTPSVQKETAVIFKGISFPGKKIFVLKDGQIQILTLKNGQTQYSAPSDQKGNFEIKILISSPGTYNFSLYAEDEYGQKSKPNVIQTEIKKDQTKIIDNIIISPTIHTDKNQVRRGENITISGQGLFKTNTTIIINQPELFLIEKLTDSQGKYIYTLDSGLLDFGKYTTWAYNNQDHPSTQISFTVSTANINSESIKLPCTKCDINNDTRINLVDFSIMIYGLNNEISSETLEKIDINFDKKIDLKDFSILASHWTG